MICPHCGNMFYTSLDCWDMTDDIASSVVEMTYHLRCPVCNGEITLQAKGDKVITEDTEHNNNDKDGDDE